MDNIGNLTVLIGKNSSGKSNLLEALSLFFDHFALAGGTTSGLNEYFWHNRRTTNPIHFTVTIKLNERECEEIFPPEIMELVKGRSPQSCDMLTISRQITNLQGTWRTEYLKWADLSLIKSDQPITPEEFNKQLSSTKLSASVEDLVTKAYREVLHRDPDPSGMETYSRLLREGKTVEWLKNQLRESEEFKQKFGSSAQPTIPPTSMPSITSETLTKINSNILERVRGKFKLIAAIRDVRNPVAYRMTLIDSAIQSRLWSLNQSTAVPDEMKYTDIESSFRRITDQRLDFAQGQIFIRKVGRRFPLYFEGGGIQGIINTIYELRSEPGKSFVFGIEEPEAHSHPELQRKFFDDLKLISAQKQIFIATHSPIFIDKANPEDTWIVKIVDGKTEIQRIKELKEVLEEIGARPSDIFFFADRILFVEGKTEETIIPAFAERLGIDLRDLAIIPVEGKDQARLHLKTWIKITRNVLPIFLILDNDAKKAVDELIREGLIEHEKCHLWQKGSIEAYYPLEILSTALDELNSRYNLEMNVSEIMEKIRKGELTPDKIDLGGKRKLLDKSWEVILGGTVTKILREKEVHISDEVRRALEKAVE
jgi:hypothetical protein